MFQQEKDILTLQEEEIGALLTLEGCDAIGSSLTRLQTLYRLGVRSVGLTWNYANAVADGALETRGAGLSDFWEAGRTTVERIPLMDRCLPFVRTGIFGM
ncbi:hypothetical protein GCM10020331_049170 [Ectobacillus funiculus]